MPKKFKGSLKIKGRVKLSGVTYHNQGCLIEIMSRHFESDETVTLIIAAQHLVFGVDFFSLSQG